MSICLRRREFIAGLGGAAAWPLAAPAEQPAIPVIGWLAAGRVPPDSPNILSRAFFGALAQAGYVLGRNLAIEFRPEISKIRS